MSLCCSAQGAGAEPRWSIQSLKVMEGQSIYKQSLIKGLLFLFITDSGWGKGGGHANGRTGFRLLERQKAVRAFHSRCSMMRF